ncbi:MAG: helix-turn-helix transcriptional regulator [Vallitaleaceae bacterium]|nr:helix-turn-helix transcriptional regulator [Vallitaleaceae bacterium]
MYIHNLLLNSYHDSTYVSEYLAGLIDFVFVYIHSPAIIFIEDISYSITRPSIVLLNQNTPHKYFPTGSEYRDDYLHFAPENPDDFIENLAFPMNQPIPVQDDYWIRHSLEAIKREFENPTKFSPRSIHHLTYLLILYVGEQWNLLHRNHDKDPHYDDLLLIREQIFRHPEKDWHIEQLAKEIHLSPSYFQVLYKQCFSVTCMTDVINSRVNMAKQLLSSTNFTINEIALQTGYNQVYHFIRQFKKSTGLTPGAYRKKTL